MRAVIYARISHDRTGERAGVQRQEADCRALCDRNGWEVAAVHVDNDLSAYRGKPRPGWAAVVETVKAGDAGALVGWHPDRFTRHTRELEDLIELVEAAGLAVATVTAGEYDLSSPSGRLVARQLGAVARYESEHKAERQRRKHLELAEQGKRSGGGRAFGWVFDDTGREVLEPSEAALVREAARRVLAGETLRAVCADWSTRGITSVFGKPWSQVTMRRLLTAWRTCGVRAHHGEPVADAAWPAILERETTERLRALLLDPARRRNYNPRRYLLTGLAFCGLCDAAMVARPRSDKRRCYVCASGPGFKGCGGIRVLSDELEAWVAEHALRSLDEVQVAADPPDVAAALGELERVERDLEQLARDYYADRLIGRSEFFAGRAALEARQGELRAAVAEGEQARQRRELTGRGAALRDEWPEQSFAQRRALLEALVERVVVGPAVRGRNFFDADRVTVELRS